MKYLLLIHIGPVQEFIATARRSRDLWFGSWFLSELSKAAALAVVKHEQNNLDSLIFPTPDDIKQLQPDSELNVANKIVALVSEPPTLEVTGDYVQQAVWHRLREIRRQAYKYVNGEYDKTKAKDQVDDLPEYFWVAVPYDDTQYVAVRGQAEALLLARKMTRNYKPVTSWAADTPKSSLDGIYESVIPESAYPDRDAVGDERQQKIEALFTQYGAKPAERLSGIDLLKRQGFRGHVSGFPSTSHIAALPLRHQLKEREDLKQDWQAYCQIFPQEVLKQERVPAPFGDHPLFLDSDGSLLFESRLNEYLEDPALTQAKKQLREFLQKATKGQEPLPYYALLMGDGDRMGTVIDSQETSGQHRAFSQSLAKFAIEAKKIVDEQYEGALVYSGGDDVLAFVPLHTMLSCAQTLTKTFQEISKYADLKDSQGNTPTFSVGIAVSHHLEPLSDALSLVRETERAAKKCTGKNALAISVDKRSGVVRTVVGHWGDVDTRLEKFIAYHQQEAIPDGAAYQLRDVALRLGGQAAIEQDKLLEKVAHKEGTRILGRKRSQRGAQSIDKSTLKELQGLVSSEHLSLEQLADELIIARLLATAQEQAGILKKSQGGEA